MHISLKFVLVIFLVGYQSSYLAEEEDQGYTDSVQRSGDAVESSRNQPITNKEPSAEAKTPLKKRVVAQETGIVPVNLSIPSINVDARIIPVGLETNGAMEVPKDIMEVGWYTNGARPGQSGNIVLAGHVDGYLRQGVFFNLKNVSLEDEILVSDGKEVIQYKVIKMESYPYDQGPIEEIFGYTSQKRIHLITCTGDYNSFTGTYKERLVVTAVEE